MSQTAYFGVHFVKGVPAYCSASDCETAARIAYDYALDCEVHGASEMAKCREWAEEIAGENQRVVELLALMPHMEAIVDWAREMISELHWHATRVQ